MSGCLTRLMLWTVGAVASAWVLIIALNPWALHIGGQSTPLLYWRGAGTVVAKSGKTFPLYLWFTPDRPQGISGIGHREGKSVSAHLQGRGYLCIAPGSAERLELIGTMYGGYLSDANSLISFRLLEWRPPFTINPPKRGFFDLAGVWRGQQLDMNRPNQQAIPFKSGLFIDHALVTLKWGSYDDFQTACARSR